VITGSSGCCGSPGTNVEIAVKDSSGLQIKKTVSQIKADGSFSTAIPIQNMAPGQYILEANSQILNCIAERQISVTGYFFEVFADAQTVQPNSPIKVSGSTKCCAKPQQQVQVKILDVSQKTVAASSATIKNSGAFETSIMAPQTSGDYYIIADFQNTVPECTTNSQFGINSSPVIKVLEKYTIQSLVVAPLKKGQKAKVKVECNKEMTLAIKVFSEKLGGKQELLSEKNYQCNSGFAEIGPNLDSGIHFVQATALAKPCDRCEASSNFAVGMDVDIPAPDSSPAIVALLPLVVLFLINKGKDNAQN
jgi:hypothetical protein